MYWTCYYKETSFLNIPSARSYEETESSISYTINIWQRFIVNADARNALRRGRKFTVVKTDEYFNKYLYVQLFKLKMCCQEDLVYVNHCKQLELAKFGQ